MNADEIQALLDAAPKPAEPAASVAVLNEPEEINEIEVVGAVDDQPEVSEPVSEQVAASVEPEPPKEEPAEPVSVPVETATNPAPAATGPLTNALWIKLTACGAFALALTAAVLGLVNRSAMASQVAMLTAENASLNQRCDFQQSLCARLLGDSGDPDRPFWDARTHVLDLDREFLAQVPTQVGDVNVIRARPQSLNEREELHFEITNPNALTLHRGQLLVRSSTQPRDPKQAFDYESLRSWYKTVETQVYEIGELTAGQTRRITASVSKADESDEPPAYVDFEIVFDYYSATGETTAASSQAD